MTRRVLRMRLSKVLKQFCSIALLGIFVLGCKERRPVIPDLPNVKVDPSLEMVPPLATDVQLKHLQDNPNGNVLLVADFGTHGGHHQRVIDAHIGEHLTEGTWGRA